MGPRRLYTARGWLPHAVAGIRPSAVLAPDNGAGIWAGVVAMVMTLATAHHLLLIIVAVVMMTVDLIAGMVAAFRRGDFCERVLYRGIASKGLRTLIIPCGLALDLVLISLTQSAGLADGAAQAGIFTSGALAWLIAAEIGSVVRKVTDSEGKGVVWPGILFGLRLIDTILHRRLHGEDPPERRHTDVAVRDAVEEERREAS